MAILFATEFRKEKTEILKSALCSILLRDHCVICELILMILWLIGRSPIFILFSGLIYLNSFIQAH